MSASDKADRPFDIVLYGATGFTGGLVADYLLRNIPEGGSWAVAGRNRTKLDALVARLATEMPDVPAPGVVVADTENAASLAEMARSARVVITTVGPYLEYGEPLVAACAEANSTPPRPTAATVIESTMITTESTTLVWLVGTTLVDGRPGRP